MISAKKQFGQNFLHDKAILEKIIQSIPKNIENIVEIGPGLGDLTRGLLRFSNLTSYEIDKDLYNILIVEFANDIKTGNFNLLLKDALEIWDKAGHLSKKNYFLAANLPYYVATKMVLKAIDDELCDGFVVMIQKEVALKFAAKGGDKDFSSLSVIANLQGSCEILFDVPASAFNPTPKVTSCVIKMIKRKKAVGDIFDDKEEYRAFKNFLKICFLAPRKTLFKNLSSNFNKNMLKKVFANLDLSQNIRAHELNFALFFKIFRNLKAENGQNK